MADKLSLNRNSGQSRNLAVIIGAGKTGRGFLARLIDPADYELVFVERSADLVQRLNQDGAYTIHFFGGVRRPHRIQGIAAAQAGSPEAAEWLGRASVLFVSIGESNMDAFARNLKHVLDSRPKGQHPKLRVLVCENSTSAAARLRKTLGDRAVEVEIAEAAIFCSTIEFPGTRLDIQSEAYDELPYDAARWGAFPALPAMKPIADFPSLLLRKIYTYNCFSACIAYLGAYKGYQWYADAAADAGISAILDRLAGPLDEAVARRFHITLEEQRLFSQAALRKFRDQNIRDDIARNARDVIRKLQPGDRLVAPARLILEHGGRVEPLALAIAAALIYRDPDDASLQAKLAARPVSEVFWELSGCAATEPLSRWVCRYYDLLKARTPLNKVLGSPAGV